MQQSVLHTTVHVCANCAETNPRPSIYAHCKLWMLPLGRNDAGYQLNKAKGDEEKGETLNYTVLGKFWQKRTMWQRPGYVTWKLDVLVLNAVCWHMGWSFPACMYGVCTLPELRNEARLQGDTPDTSLCLHAASLASSLGDLMMWILHKIQKETLRTATSYRLIQALVFESNA